MSWGRIDDGLHDHEKFMGFGPAATPRELWVIGLSWTHRNYRRSATPGFVPACMPAVWAGSKAKGARFAARLADAGLWEPADGGWVYHDWLDYASPDERSHFGAGEPGEPGSPDPGDVAARDHAETLVEKRRRAGRNGGRASGQARRQAAEATKHTRSTPEACASENRSKPEAHASARASYPEARASQVASQSEATAKQPEPETPGRACFSLPGVDAGARARGGQAHTGEAPAATHTRETREKDLRMVVLETIATHTGGAITGERAQLVADAICRGRPVADRAAYVREAIRREPARWLRYGEPAVDAVARLQSVPAPPGTAPTASPESPAAVPPVLRPVPEPEPTRMDPELRADLRRALIGTAHRRTVPGTTAAPADVTERHLSDEQRRLEEHRKNTLAEGLRKAAAENGWAWEPADQIAGSA